MSDVLAVDAAGFPTMEPGAVTNEGAASMAGDIKPLDHWRRLGEVVAKVVADPPWWSDGWVKVETVPARAPFPARALRDRPWDISALVEE